LVNFSSLYDRSRRRSCPEPSPLFHVSHVLRAFVEEMEAKPGYEVLDLGPVCGENIHLLSQKAKKLYICDMFFRMDRDQRRGVPSEQAWRHLNYPFRSFDGILLWDLVVRLEDRQAKKLVQRCVDMIRPGGKVAVFALGQAVDPGMVYAFVLEDDFRISLRPQPHLALPLQSLQTRDILDIMKPFKQIRSFMYTNGIREFLFQYE
jgi:hypothetical protein